MTLSRSCFQVGLGVLLMASSLAAPFAWASVPDESALVLGSRRELFVDDYLIATTHGVSPKLHEPVAKGTALVFDRPWEGVTSGYASFFQDQGIFRMYYRGRSDPSYTMRSALRAGEAIVPEHPSVTCYAESRDGITWVRPSLGLFEFNNSKDNNIVWTGEGADNFFAFLDANPSVSAAERYKAVGSRGFEGDKRPPALLGFVSADGRHWRLAAENPILTDGAFDSLNVVFWDPVRGDYAAIYRDFAAGVRSIKYAHSKDFLHWSPGQWADFGDAPAQHLYTNATIPYFRAPQIFVAMPRRFFPWKTYYREMEEKDPGVSDAVFMSSRDGIHWKRFEEAWIRPGLDPRDWVHRANTPACGVLPTGTSEISFFIERNYTFPTNRIERMALRTDGFVSANAGVPGGELVTKPLIFSGSQLSLNYSTSAYGSLRIEVQDATGQPIPGFYLEESPLIFGDQIDATISWGHSGEQSHADALRVLSGRAIRLRFVLRDADLYALQFK